MVRRTLIIIAVFWGVSMLVLVYIYFARNFTQYMDTVPKESSVSGSLTLSSSAFENGASIPAQYTCDVPAQAGDKQLSPPLSIRGAPAGTQSFVLIVQDPDVPKSLQPDGTFLHWVVFNIPAQTREIGIGEAAGIEGASENGVAGYVSPCPPPQYEPREHRYYFELYALDTMLDLSEGAAVEDVRRGMDGHTLERTTLLGRYARREK